MSVVCEGVEPVSSASSGLESEAVRMFRHYPGNPRWSSRG